jgi:hypothetical protein
MTLAIMPNPQLQTVVEAVGRKNATSRACPLTDLLQDYDMAYIVEVVVTT